MGFNSKEFGVFVRQVRTASGMTVQEFADAAGITARQNLSRIESGDILNPSFEAVHGILRVISELDLIKRGNIEIADYSPEIIWLVKMYIMNEPQPPLWTLGEWKEGKSAAVDVVKCQTSERQAPETLFHKYSVPDIELGLALVDTMKWYPKLKEEFQELWNEIRKNFSDPDSVDFSRIIHDETKRNNTLFYKELNRGLRVMSSGKSLPQPYKFMILLLRILQKQMDGYGDRQSNVPPKVRRLQRDEDIDFV